MGPHALFVSSDRHVDVALNLLSLIVGGALLASVAWLLLMWLNPATVVVDHGDVGPPAWASTSDGQHSPMREPRINLTREFALSPPKLELDFALPYLPKVYRCEHRGQVTYSDWPCTVGRVRAIAIRPS